MNGIHDLGGMDGFGPVEPELHGRAYHEDWERTVFALVISLLVEEQFNLDQFRYAIERIEPVDYLTSSYYERWLQAAMSLLRDQGVLDEKRPGPGDRGDEQPDELRIKKILKRIESLGVEPASEPAPELENGTPVRVRNHHPESHTRHPRYVRGSRGTIDEFLGSWPLADTKALGREPSPEPLYAVVFEAEELWGESAEPGVSLSLDLWESYLEPLT